MEILYHKLFSLPLHSKGWHSSIIEHDLCEWGYQDLLITKSHYFIIFNSCDIFNY